MSIPDYQTLMLPVLRLTAEGIARVPDMLERIQREFSLSDEQMSQALPKGRTTVIASNTHWARTYMSKAGLVRPVKRGHFTVTDRGLGILAEKPQRIDNSVLRRFSEFEEWLGRANSRNGGDKRSPPDGLGVEEPAPTATPRERIEQASVELTTALADELLERLIEGTPLFFEHAVVDLLTAMGYGGGRENAGQKLGKSGDGGIDGVINEDALGLDAVYVQAKRYASENTVGRPAIQQFVGSLTGEGANKGVFVTTSSFSSEALRYVERISQRIVLIDGQRLARLMIAHGVGVRPVETILLNEIDENFFNDE